jgi:hypothetical protein
MRRVVSLKVIVVVVRPQFAPLTLRGHLGIPQLPVTVGPDVPLLLTADEALRDPGRIQHGVVRQLPTTGGFLDAVHPHDPSGWFGPEHREVTGQRPQVPPTNQRINLTSEARRDPFTDHLFAFALPASSNRIELHFQPTIDRTGGKT